MYVLKHVLKHKRDCLCHPSSLVAPLYPGKHGEHIAHLDAGPWSLLQDTELLPRGATCPRKSTSGHTVERNR